MTKHDYKQNAYYVIYLIRCVLHDKEPAKEKLDKMELEQLFEVAKVHSLAAMVAYALESVGIYDPAFEEEKNKAIRKNILFDAERSKLLNILEEQKIWYMPLKGAVLKDIYPKIGMRQMADNDILFDMSRRADVSRIMNDLGFILKAEREAVDEYVKEPI
ncbi:MAG: nucleotidyltransferase family protein, partial [Clostridia bacterium]|nr:nucleotidyltransferase family protein [Clostridia bacterium]